MDVPVPTRPRVPRGAASLSVPHRLVLRDTQKKVPPSVYTLEMLRSTEERLANATEVHPPRILELLHVTTHRKLSSVDVDRALFQPFPSRLVFQNFSPGQTYRLPLELFNHDKVSRAVRLEPDDSQYFHAICLDDGSQTVAPGLRATFSVIFEPQENKDYHHRLVFVTERERFEVPVVAIGPRAVLDFRDQLVLPTCPVKASTETTQLVRNIGNSLARFKLQTTRPFSVAPSSGSLDVGDSIQVTVTFNPMNVGNHQQDLILHYHTGEDVYISLSGTCQELDTHLSSDSVVLKRTYITLTSAHMVSLTNTSHIPLQYIWTPWPRPIEEEAILLGDSSKEEAKRERHQAAVHRLSLPPPQALQDDGCQASKDTLDALSDGCITVEPMEGEIWPNLTAQFHIVFKPGEAKLYQQTIYCDITGRESGLPLTIQGEGVGPNIELNYNLWDMENVVIKDKLCYEVLMSNRGLIDAPFSLSSPNTTFGRCFSSSPEEGVVPAGEHQVVKVTFQSYTLGSFSEDLQLRVQGQPEPLTLTFRGCVTGPSLHFNVSELSFGDVAFGFPQTSICTLFNMSLVPVNFSLRVLGDGLGPPSITCVKQVHEAFRDRWQGSTARDLKSQPMELSVSPATGLVDLMSSEDIEVTLCSNTVKRYRLALAVDVEGVGEEVLTLPINARCVVPDVTVETPLLDFERCFLGHRYEHTVRVTNTSSVGACYGVMGQEYEESPSVLFGSSKPRGVMHPHSSEDIPVYLLAKAVGRQHHTLRIAVFGSSHPPLEVSLMCLGQGPVVHIHKKQLDFGKIPVLKDTTKTLQLLNQSPIPAYFATRTTKKSFWRVEPSEGAVPSESQLELRVVAHFRDTTQCEDTLEVSIQDAQTHTVALSAKGTGTTIVSDRPLAPTLDLGTHFSHDPYRYPFTLTNLGQRTHRLYWGADGFWPSDKAHVRKTPWSRTSLPPISAPMKKTAVSSGPWVPPPRRKPVFSISPPRVELYPGCSVDMVLSGFSDSPEVVREHLECRGIVGNQGCCEHIMSVDVTCRFVTPMISIQPKQLTFHINKVPGTNPTPLYEKLVLKNTSTLTVSMETCVMAPFSLCDAHGVYSSSTAQSMVLGGGRQTELWICFNPAFCQDRVSRVVHEFLEVHYHGHPHQDTVELHAEVHFPNLHFSTDSVDFGCVLNCTETQREITVTNCSPLPVSYRWTFLMEQKHRETEARGRPAEEMPTNLGNEEDGDSASPPSSAPFSPLLEPHEQSFTQSTVHVEEMFDVLPIYGRLQPGEQQPITFSFYGHSYVSREVVAQCHVEEGPTYEVKLQGEASDLTYRLDLTHVDLGQQLFDHVAEAELTLKNTGKVGFQFSVLQQETEVRCVETEEPMTSSSPTGGDQTEMVKPGQPVVLPTNGRVDAGAEQSLRVLYLPGVPEAFERRFQLQVAHLPPQEVTLTGEGVFPRISLNLPRDLSLDRYREVVQRAVATMEAHQDLEESRDVGGESPTEASCILTYDDLLQMEVERTLVKENAGALLEIQDGRKQWKLSKFLLPDHVLDFGFVIPGQVLSHTVNVVNTGCVAVSFSANRTLLPGTGFTAEFDRVKKLPCGETYTFTVTFDPHRADVQMGEVSVVMPIQVRGGPVVPVRLCAVVTVPGITVSTDEVEFDTVQRGMCQMKTIQLFNHQSVPCHWSIAEKLKPLKKVDKFVPLYQRKKFLQDQRPPPAVFEAVPASGVTLPGQRVNVHIKFSPVEEHLYNRKLAVHVADGARQLSITVRGQGAEPQLEFCPAALDLGSSLPSSTEVEAEITVKNVCSFPIEFYCLELDSQYLEEEKILRLMQGYHDNGTLLLPPRTPGQSLPSELLDFYKEQRPLVEDEAEDGEGEQAEPEATMSVEPVELLLSDLSTEGIAERLRRLEADPVSRAVARHMGVDLSADGLAALNRKGIGVVVYGAPSTDTSSAAAALSQYYGAQFLTVDAVVTEAILWGASPVSLTARQLMDDAAAAYTQKKADDAALRGGGATTPRAEAPPDVLAPPPNPPVAPPPSETMQLALQLGGDSTSLQNLLPEQLLVQILAERLQSRDCRHGAVVQGLESLYTTVPSNTLQVILKALNDRKHVYVVDVCDSYDALKARQAARREAEEVLQRKLEDEEQQWLQELDEDEYDALPEEMKERINQRCKLRLKNRDLKRMEKEQEELRQQEVKRLQDEELKRRNKKDVKKESKEVIKKKNALEGKQSTEPLDGRRRSSIKNSKESLVDAKDTNNSREAADESQHNKDDSHNEAEATHTPNLDETEKSVVDELQSHFSSYERTRVEVDHILRHWDRTRGFLLVPLPSEDPPPVPETPVGKKSKKSTSKVLSPIPSQTFVQAEADVETAKAPQPVAIPHIVLKRTEEDSQDVVELLVGAALPHLDEVLEELGSGPSGPPIPPPVTFSIVPFPKSRSVGPPAADHFTFLLPSEPEDQADDKDEGVAAKAEVVKDKEKKGRESQRSKRRVSAKTKAKASDPPRSPALVPDGAAAEPDQRHRNVELKRSQSVTTFRWVVPANGEVVLKIWFYSDVPGTFEQMFSFEVLGTQRQYQLGCKATSSYPNICTQHRTLFAHSKKVPQVEDVHHRAYVINPGFFDFGPLLCSKTRDRYKENKYPENTERLVIHNVSGLEADIQFRFQHDTQATTYLLDPPTMTLKPDQKQELTVWAYPTKLGQIKDSVMCCIKDNPEPVVVPLSCWGVRPELDLDSKHLAFDRVLVHRRDSRTVNLHNKTALPVSWRLQGVEELGDGFSVPLDHGVVSPYSCFPLSLHFRAKKPLHIKRIIRLEISDVEKILGIVHTENIHVSVEAYDIALDITPGLDFGTIRVFEEAKLPLKMKNQGKYEIAYRFSLKQTGSTQPHLESLLSVTPPSGSVMPGDRHMGVHVLCRPKREVVLREQPVLLCQVIEPRLGSGEETIAIIPITVSLQSVFSRYKVTPAPELDFGPLVYGCRKSQSFSIENTGVFETRFAIVPVSADLVPGARPGVLGQSKKVPLENQAVKAAGAGSKLRADSFQRDMGVTQNRITMGVFSVFPCTGTLQPGCQQVVTVDCVGEQVGGWEQGLLIDISDRDPSEHPEGMSYRLKAEVYRPGIVCDINSVFEEYHLCHDSSQLSSERFSNADGIYVIDENKFVFNKVLVGQTAKGRFKLKNSSKVPCTLSLTVKHAGAKVSPHVDVFCLSSPTVCIPGQSQAFAVVNFTPQAVQFYSAAFEATLEGTSRMTPTFRSKVLEFELTGEATLPSVCLVRPVTKDSGGRPALQFRRVLVGRRRTLPLVLLNDGVVAAQVQVDMLDKQGVFTLKAAPGNDFSSITSTKLQSTTDPGHRLVHRAAATLNANEQVALEVGFCSDLPQSVEANMTLQVEDNVYNNTIIALTAEAYQETITLDHIGRSRSTARPEDDHDDYQVMDFGDCHMGRSYQESLTMTNHSQDQVLRFEWPPAGPQVSFSPQVGHLHAGCSKEVSVTFCSDQPLSLKRQSMRCRVCEVDLDQPVDQVSDWDDRQKTNPHKPLPAAPLQPPATKKVVKADPEPSCSVVDGSIRNLELFISAVCDYVKFSCSADSIHFRDTMLYQTSLHQLQMVNDGGIALEFSWDVLMDMNFNTSCDRAAEEEEEEAKGNPEALAFKVEPRVGTIDPGSQQDFTVIFSPSEAAQFEGRLVCSVPNLQDGAHSPCVSVRGRCLLPHCHFELDDSDYISGGRRRNPDLRGPVSPNTRVVEFHAVGSCTKTMRCFFVVNPTTKPLSFKWKCDDPSSQSFRCLTPSGNIQPKKKTEVCFEYEAKQVEVVESLWTFCMDTLSLSVPFLLVGITREPLVYLDRAHLDFGELPVGVQAQLTVTVVSAEVVPFHLSVLASSVLSEDQQSRLMLEPMTGWVEPKGRLTVSVSFKPLHEGYVSFRPLVKVRGKSEPLALTAKADCVTMTTSVRVQNPSGDFREVSPDRPDTLDFGKVGISEQHSFNFLVSNQSRLSQDVTYDLAAPHQLLQHLEMTPQTAVVEPGEQLQCVLLFKPQNVCHLQNVRLSIKVKHGLTFTVDVRGRAVAAHLDFSFTAHNFGKCYLFSPGISPASQTLVISNKGKRDVSVECQFRNTSDLEVDFQPGVLPPGADMNVALTFCPREARRYDQTLSFILNNCVKRQVRLLGQGVKMKGVEVELDQNQLAFGAVVQHCRSSKTVVLTNTGDVGTRFHWKKENFPPDLWVSPADGFICPGAQLPCDVSFAPVKLRHHIRSDTLCCFVEGVSSTVALTVTSACIEASTRKEVVSFVCPVRSAHTQTLTVSNPTQQQCSVTPVTEGEQWSSAGPMTLEALQSTTTHITYRPLTMTADAQKHLGSVFVPFPDGSGVLYLLQGTAEAPKAEGTLAHELPAKTVHTELLSVNNWLPWQQRFHVLIEVLKPDKPDPTVSLKGPDYIDVPALAKKHYKMCFYALREGTYNAKVMFRNDASGEYLFYLVTFKVTSPGVLSTMELVTTVRRMTTATVEVENPLSTAVCLSTECKCPDISVEPQQVAPAQSKVVVSLAYLPLHVGVSTARLTLCSNELGSFHYDLHLTALDPAPEKTVHFNTSLGSSQTVLLKFTNFSRVRTDYSCKTDQPDFIVDRTVSAGPGFHVGSEAVVEVCFEPHQQGEVTAQLTLSSAVGGEYVFQFHGICRPPKAQGPFSIRDGRHVSIPFKNVFLHNATFSYQVDNPCFTIKGLDSLLSKKTHNIQVSFKAPQGDFPGPWFSKASVSSQCSDRHSQPLSWVFYLKGYRPESS